MVELIVLGAFALSLFVCVGLGVSILYALISYLTGTAFGTAATMGVICAALAAGAFPPSILAAPSSPVHTLATAALQCPPAPCSSARSPARIFTATLAGW